MKSFIHRIYNTSGLDHVALAIVLAGMIWTNIYYKFWKDPHRIIVQDVILYYEYLPATFIYKDLTLSFTEKDPEYFKDKVWKITTQEGKAISKMTMGLAVLYTPFFLAAHFLAEPLGYNADGYTIPYRVALIISSMVYAIIGFIFLIKLLRKYFGRSAIAITVLALGLGTNLYFYTTIEPTMSHAYSFFLFALFFYLTDAWLNKPSWTNSLILGLTWGMIILVRPSNGIIIVLLLLWKVDSLHSLTDRIKFLIHRYLKVILTGLTGIIVFLPQIIYWKFNTGQYFYYSYGGERFFFNDPAFIQGMFSYRKGWLVYTPIMVFSLLGIIILYFKERKFFWPILIYTFLNLYVVWSWWCWWYGGGFGQRALIESYAILAFPFATFTKFILERKILIRVIFLVFLAVFISLNIFQTRQYYIGIIHWDSMSGYSYRDSFFRVKIAPNFYNHLDHADYQAALKGDR